MISKKKISVKSIDWEGRYHNTGSSTGLFLLINGKSKCVTSETCRESFHSYWEDNPECNLVGFTKGGALNVAAVSKFFDLIENKLKIGDRTEIIRTDQKDLIIFKVARFWKQNALRRGILSIFIRAACAYHKPKMSIGDTLLAYGLVSDKIMFFGHFLNGYTKPKNSGVNNSMVNETWSEQWQPEKKVDEDDQEDDAPAADWEIKKILKK